MKKLFNLLVLSVALLTALSSCNKDKEESEALSPLGMGVFVLNEGNFNSGNASVSFMKCTDASVKNKIFSSRNNRSLGDVAQSMSIIGNRAYIVVANSQKVEVVNASTFASLGVISGGLDNPRYIAETTNDRAYITDWTIGGVAIVNLNSNSVIGTIPTGIGPEGIYVKGNEAFVANSGGFGDDSTITVIDINTNTVTDTIHLTSFKPVSIVEDKNGKLWVLCQGKYGDFVSPATMTVSRLVRINPVNHNIEQSINLGTVGGHGVRLVIDGDGDDLYYTYGTSFTGNEVYKMNITDFGASSTPIIDKQFYGLGIDPLTNIVYGGLGDFTQNTYTYRYRGTNGALIDSILVGVAPNAYVFN